ncbi:serine/threonine/tyrosine-interacting protein isoform X6 [Myotis myotis]|nr:serine/threonine/tyrosine-interacting protein isoform X6 [Myotis myotis]XP_036163130.1 serine/threonine/tyrosine-interacting protein isoform X6 [Myotis myotis]
MKSKLPILQKHGVTHIICIRQNIEANFIKPNFQQLFRYLVLDIADNPVENIIRFFPMTKEFIDGSLQTGGKVLVHGNAGISRSAAFVIAYIMETFGMKYRDAFAYVQERRFCINPNAGFVHQLQEYEAIYLAKLTIQMMSPLQIERSLSVHSGTAGSSKSFPVAFPYNWPLSPHALDFPEIFQICSSWHQHTPNLSSVAPGPALVTAYPGPQVGLFWAPPD